MATEYWDGIPLNAMGDSWEATTSKIGDQDPKFVLKHGYYPFLDGMFMDRAEVTGGTYSIDKPLVLDDTGNARWTLPYQSYQPTQIDVTTRMQVGWGKSEADFSISNDEMLACSGEAELFDEAEKRDKSAQLDLCNLTEEQFWATYDSDAKKALPLDYWLPKIAAGQATGAFGFYGGHALTTGGAVGNIAAATSGDNTTAIAGGKERWRSWQGAYTSENWDELVELMNHAFLDCQLHVPKIVHGVTPTDGDPRIIYTGKEVFAGLRHFAEEFSHDRKDVKLKDNGDLLFWDIPIKYVPFLSAATQAREPVYMINRNTFAPKALAGMNWKRQGPINDRTQPEVYTTFNFLKFQIILMNRRANACIATV